MKSLQKSFFVPTIFKEITFLCVFTLVSNLSLAQNKLAENLVPNPSFEKHKNKSGDIKNATPWIGIGTVDYYMKPEKRDTSRYKGGRTGNSYAGLRFQRDYKEYMYVQLAVPLEKDMIYHFRMFVRLLNNKNVTVTVKQLGVYFSDIPFTAGIIFDKESIVDSTYKKGISGTFDWIPIQGDYVAHGGEKYIIIGNFRTKMKDDFVKNKKLSFSFQEAYYYIDDVLLQKKLDTVVSTKPQPSILIPDSLYTGQEIEINNIQFEKGTERILITSHKVLDDLVKILNNHPFMPIQINGFADTPSTSKNKAKVVYEYLVSHGVINPMVYRGIVSTSVEKVDKIIVVIIKQ